MFTSAPAFSPSRFFAFSLHVPRNEALPFPKKVYKEALLPDFSEVLQEDSFAEVAFSWSEEGLFFEVHSKKEFEDCLYPNYEAGDAFEVFIDTRDFKSSFINRFCHHFVFLPRPVNGVQMQEITRFRGEEERSLCDPKDLFMETEFTKKGYVLRIKIPGECLHGYDPISWNKLAICYRISRVGGSPQHLPSSSVLYPIEQHPNLWCSCILENEA